MKHLLTLPAIALLLLAAPASAQNVPGGHFIENFDLNEDGMVTLEEVREKRGDIFYMVDQDEDNVLNSEEYDLFDATRA
ncbi:MAG TPA: EF-hand domain-containing protein, partial [Aliiroseovarius sp.]|nr:EF-hand domain-containing protein [Aliiroseovarius sp.]